jgi:magnesium chelatase family protein
MPASDVKGEPRTHPHGDCELRLRGPGSSHGHQPAPADIRKEGPALDLAIALGMLFASDGAVPATLREYVIAGELALDGRTRPIKGSLSMAMMAKREGYRGFILPLANANEAAVVERLEVIGVSSLTDAVGLLNEQLPIEPTAIDLEETFAKAAQYDVDFADVRGQGVRQAGRHARGGWRT